MQKILQPVSALNEQMVSRLGGKGPRILLPQDTLKLGPPRGQDNLLPQTENKGNRYWGLGELIRYCSGTD